MSPPLLPAVLPDAVATAEMYSDPGDLAPLPEEEPLIARSVAKRRNEFITVRHCARVALSTLGVGPVPILKGDKGEPCWPGGVVGSLTHCEGFRGAVVARGTEVRSVGIDAEPHAMLPDGVLDAIALPVERTELADLGGNLHWDRILFCAKEATYKAWFPLTHRWLGFEDAHITFTLDSSGQFGDVPVADSDRPDRRVGAAADRIAGSLDDGQRPCRDGDLAVKPAPPPPGLVIVDKPAGMTSHDVVGRCRRLFGTRKVGHAGTLDPMATGVLVVGIERATKILGLLTATDKTYAATIRLGQTTSTEDAEGEVLQSVSGRTCDRRGRSSRQSRSCAARSIRCPRRSAPSRWAVSARTSWCVRVRRRNCRPAG